MKSSAITKIVLFAVLIVVLLAILFTGMAMKKFPFLTANKIDPSAYTATGNAAFPANTINRMQIDWVAGNIRFETADTDTITITEHTSDAKHPMVITQKDPLLIIQDREDNKKVSIQKSAVIKDLTITVPTGWVCDSLEINTASTGIDLANMTVRNVDINSASSTCNFDNCEIGLLDVDTASGDVFLTGTLERLDMDGASASAVISVTNHPIEILVDGMSGKLDLTLPEDCGFTFTRESLSGSFKCDFDTRASGDSHIYGDGACKINLEGVSASAAIHHAK